jgi:hypothetical protein
LEQDVDRTQIVDLLKKNDRAVARALVVLNQRQTDSEQATESTRYRNGQGFRPCHAKMGTSMANFFTRRGHLTPKQVAYWRAPMKGGKMRIEIYAGQLLEIAQARAATLAQNTAQPQTQKRPSLAAECYGNLMEERMVLLEQLDSAEGVAAWTIRGRLEQIDQAVRSMQAEAEMHRMEAAADRAETLRDEAAKHAARAAMEA